MGWAGDGTRDEAFVKNRFFFFFVCVLGKMKKKRLFVLGKHLFRLVCFVLRFFRLFQHRDFRKGLLI